MGWKELVYSRGLLQAAEWHSDKVGFIDGEYRGTYARHVERVARLSAGTKMCFADGTFAPAAPAF